MRIAQIAPLAESVPPKLYGGTERVVAWLVDELVSLGHEVTLFASGNSRTRGKLHPVWQPCKARVRLPLDAIHTGHAIRRSKLEASLKCRSCRKGRYAPARDQADRHTRGYPYRRVHAA